MVQIITDSSTLYKPEEAKALGFEAVPLCVNVPQPVSIDVSV